MKQTMLVTEINGTEERNNFFEEEPTEDYVLIDRENSVILYDATVRARGPREAVIKTAKALGMEFSDKTKEYIDLASGKVVRGHSEYWIGCTPVQVSRMCKGLYWVNFTVRDADKVKAALA